MYWHETIQIMLTWSFQTLKILRCKGYPSDILLATTPYLQLSWFISLSGFFTNMLTVRILYHDVSIDTILDGH